MMGPRGSLPVWAHYALLFAAVTLLVLALAPLEPLLRGRSLDVPLWASIASCGLLVALGWFWLGRVYRAAHLARWIAEEGGRVEQAPQLVRGRLGALQIRARFGNPFWASTRPSLRLGERAPGEPRFRLVPDVTYVEHVWLADLSPLAPLDLAFEIRNGVAALEPGAAPEPIASAIHAAAAGAGAEPVPVAVWVRPRFLRVGTSGGSWTGAALARQVEAAHAFAVRLVGELAPSFAALDADRFDVQLDSRGGVTVEERAPKASGSLSVALALAALAALLAPLPARADVASGVQYLVGSQAADGSWTGTDVRSVQATSEALRTLQQVGAPAGPRAAAADFLTAAPVQDADDLARRIPVLAAEGRDVATLAAQLSAQVQDGGFGLTRDFAPDPLDTSLALIALARSGLATGEVAFTALVGLVGAQNDDGGWPCVARGTSRTACTAQALLALAEYRTVYQLDAHVTTGAEYLLARIEPGGGFGGGAEALDESALGTRALLALEDEIAGRRGAVLAYLAGAQQADGSWEGDPYRTALGIGAVEALTSTPFCGDGAQNRPAEACDGSDLTGLTCNTLGFGNGTLACSTACTFDTSGCAAAPVCGDGLRNQSGETCDGSDLAGATCESEGFPAGGTLACALDCASFDVSGCTVLPSCGDGVVNQAGEECDAADLAGLSCQVLGLGGGQLACDVNCQLDTSECDAPSFVLDNQGREFVIGFLRNLSAGQHELHLTAEVATTARIEYPLGAPTFVQNVAVMPGQVTIVTLPITASTSWQSNQIRRNAVRVSSPEEVVVYVINRAPATSDAGMAFPVDALNTEYVVSTYRRTIAQDATEFVVLAPFDGTTVTITPRNAVTGHPAGVPFQRTLNRGEGYFLSTTADLTGTTISADRPVAVVNGNVCTQVPLGVFACDHVFEIAQPVQTWSRAVPVANLPNRPGGSIYRVVAAVDGTEVTLDGSPVATLDRGGVFETARIAGNHLFAANEPIFVTQFMSSQSSPGAVRGDPAMGNMIPPEQYRDGYTFSTVGGQQFVENFLTVIAPNAGVGSVLLDGTPIAAGSYTPIPGTDYSAAAVPLTSGTHTTTAPVRHGITVEGYNSFDSYLYPGGAQFEFINQFCGDGARNLENEDCDTNDFGGHTCTDFGFTAGSLACTDACEVDTSGCVGVEATDEDEDGFPLPEDCDDLDPAVNPGASEIPGNGVDDDCNPGTPDVIAPGAASCTLVTDAQLYGAQETIRIDADVRNETAGVSLEGVVLALRVEGQGAALLEDTRHELAALAPGERRELPFFVGTAATAPGPLAITAALEAGGATIATCSASAAIQSSLAGGALLVGSVEATPAVAEVGAAVQIAYAVENVGNAALAPAALEILIVDPTENEVIATLTDSATLAPSASVSRTQPAPALPEGTYLVVLRAGAGTARDTLASAGLRIVPPPNLPPSCSGASLSKTSLWPPNHKFHEISVSGVTDPDGDPLDVQVYAVTQDEPTAEPGGKCPDAVIAEGRVRLRAERLGGGNGRIYEVDVRATDPSGASCTKALTVCVPHDQSGGSCPASAATIDSTLCD
jgi:hypothetical protein